MALQTARIKEWYSGSTPVGFIDMIWNDQNLRVDHFTARNESALDARFVILTPAGAPFRQLYIPPRDADDATLAANGFTRLSPTAVTRDIAPGSTMRVALSPDGDAFPLTNGWFDQFSVPAAADPGVAGV